MKSILVATALLLFGISAFAQTQTQTNCDVNGNQMNCTSTSTDNSAANAAAAQSQKDLDESSRQLGATIGTVIARRRTEHDLEKKVSLNLDYCGGHPNEHVLNPANNKVVGCGAFVERVKMLCITYPKTSSCKHVPAMPAAESSEGAASAAPTVASVPAPIPAPASASSVLKASALPATPTTAPAISAVPAPPALTEEQKDAASYCKRNPTATITWNDGTVSPCSSVPGVR